MIDTSFSYILLVLHDLYFSQAGIPQKLALAHSLWNTRLDAIYIIHIKELEQFNMAH